MGELNLDKFERMWGQESQWQSKCTQDTREKVNIISNCCPTANNEVARLSHDSRERKQLAHSI